MKKILIFIYFIIINSQFCLANNQTELKTMTIDEFLSGKDPKRWEKLDLNDKGVVRYKDRIILNYNNVPLTDDTSFYDMELLMVTRAMKIKPRFGCDPNDTKKNGTMGCYINNPDKNQTLFIRRKK